MQYIFLTIECCLYIWFMSIDLQTAGDISLGLQLKFLSIVLCCVYTFLLYVRKQAHSRFLCVSFLFLVCSDYFLLLSDSYDRGLITFIGVQLCFLFHLKRGDTKSGRIQIIKCIAILLVSAGVVLFVIQAFGIQLEETLVLATVYFLLFLFNVVESVRSCRRSKNLSVHLFSIGLLLYFLCDINVGIFNLSDYLVLSDGIYPVLYEFSVIAMWLFYLPGIVLITISNHETLQDSQNF